VPVAQNKINFVTEGAGKIIGVGNGDPSCHEPDVYRSDRTRAHNVDVNDWRWHLADMPRNNSTLPEYANDFADSAWNHLKAGGDTMTIKTENTTAIYRARFTLTEEDLKGVGAQICFGGCDDEGWYFVNGHIRRRITRLAGAAGIRHQEIHMNLIIRRVILPFVAVAAGGIYMRKRLRTSDTAAPSPGTNDICQLSTRGDQTCA
jgi:hypothetical protein